MGATPPPTPPAGGSARATPPITPDEWPRVKALFFAAQDAAPAERADVLAAGDVEAPIRAHVERLLAAADTIADAGGGRFETPAAHALLGAPVPAPAWADRAAALVGQTLGTWTVVRRIATGGMGAVYEAERGGDESAGKQRAAIKTIIWQGASGEVLVRRFRTERRILAGLRHPNIAQLLDGDATDDGLPYFVMEYVDGEPIDAYCDRHTLGIPERLALFRQVCAAVQHAHGALVVHRDLKPSNVFVTAGGSVKLLDFGIAKLVSEERTDGAARTPRTLGTLTGAGVAPFTAAFAAPEQVSGGRVSIATDVYALGALLYLLLTGRTPLGTDVLTPAEAVLAIRDEVVAPPSAAAVASASADAAGRRGLPSADRLARALRGELDAITLMALRKEPERRYATVDALAEDVRRHLAHERVLARPDTFAYRARRLLRRRRATVTGVAVGALALLAGSALALQQAARARAARNEAQAREQDVRALANTLLAAPTGDAAVSVPGATALQATLAERARAYLDGLAAAGRRDPLLDRQLAFAYQRLGDVRGNPTQPNLGDVAGAHEAFLRAWALVRRAESALPPDSTDGLAATVLERLADVEAPLGNTAQAVERMRQAIGYRERIAARDSAATVPARRLAIALLKLGDVEGNPAFVNAGRPKDAVASYTRAIGILDAPPLAADTAFETRRYQALIRERLGRMYQTLGDFPAAAATLRESLRLRYAVYESRPTNLEAKRDVAVSHYLVADVLLAQGDLAGAAAQADSAIPIRRALLRDDPSDVRFMRGLGLTMGQLARVRAAAGDAVAARRLADSSLGWFDRYLHGKPPNEVDRVEMERVRAVLRPGR